MNGYCRSLSATVALLVLLAAGCASTGPAPVENRNPEARRARPVAPAASPVRAHARSDRYRVQRGDTLYSIAFRHGVDYRDLAAWNDIAPPYTIYPGRELRLTPPRHRVAAAAPPPRPASPPPPPPREPNASPAPTGSRPAPSDTAAAAPPAAPRAETPPVSDNGIAWRWPADGEIIGRYAAGDPLRQGIDIAGHAGAPVRAAADGTVVYSGNGLIGYGELIIVKHSPTFLSAYGHNRKRLVQEGDRVKAGQTIAEMGSSGTQRDELHFEIRKNGKPADPLDFLPRR